MLENNSLAKYAPILGYIMIGAGLYICYFILKELFNAYTYFEIGNGFVAEVMQKLSGQVLVFINPETPVSLGEGGAMIIATVLLFLIAWTVLSVAYSLILGGNKLLSPSIKQDLQKIKYRLSVILDNLRQNTLSKD